MELKVKKAGIDITEDKMKMDIQVEGLESLEDCRRVLQQVRDLCRNFDSKTIARIENQ